MARAKRTDRAEARRRYRATLIDESEPIDEDDVAPDDEPEADRAPRDRSRNRAAVPASSDRPARPSIAAAFRSAFRPTDLRGDFAALPRLLRHRSFLIPLAMVVGAAAVILVTAGREPISVSLAPYFLAPPPVAPVFLAGFLAPRASWLIGGLLGIIAQVAFVALLSSPALQQAATGTAAGANLAPDVFIYSFLVSTFGGAFYAAAAAWYKRFLALANPSRAARASGKPTDRTRRRGSDERPMLARRR